MGDKDDGGSAYVRAAFSGDRRGSPVAGRRGVAAASAPAIPTYQGQVCKRELEWHRKMCFIQNRFACYTANS